MEAERAFVVDSIVRSQGSLNEITIFEGKQFIGQESGEATAAPAAVPQSSAVQPGMSLFGGAVIGSLFDDSGDSSDYFFGVSERGCRLSLLVASGCGSCVSAIPFQGDVARVFLCAANFNEAPTGSEVIATPLPQGQKSKVHYTLNRSSETYVEISHGKKLGSYVERFVRSCFYLFCFYPTPRGGDTDTAHARASVLPAVCLQQQSNLLASHAQGESGVTLPLPRTYW